MNTVDLIIKNLIHNPEFISKVILITKPEYFQDCDSKIIHVIRYIYQKYKKLVSYSILEAYFRDKAKNINENELKTVLKRLKEIEQFPFETVDIDYLINETEAYFKDRALYLSIYQSVERYESKKNIDEIPHLITQALQVSIDDSIGHNYLDPKSIEEQYNFYNVEKNRFNTHLESLNKLIGGGFERKKMIVFCGQPGVGKSRILTDLSVHYVKQNLNVLYITLELSDNDVRQRIDANILDINMNDFSEIEKDYYLSKLGNIGCLGTLIIKEYTSESINSNTIDMLLHEIKIKKQIDIDILILDYITVMNTTMNLGPNSGNLYVKGKTIATELRSVICKYNLIGFTALHLNRDGWDNVDVKMGNIAESAGIAHVADVMIGMISTDEMLENNRLILKILKNRLFSMEGNRKTILGIDNSKMRHYCTEENRENDENNDDLMIKFGDIEL